MMLPFLLPLGALVLLALYVLSMYNGFINLATQIEEAWSQIDVQLKRRADLIPNLVESVKGYAKHEKGVMTEVTKARSALMGAKTPHDMAEANDMVTAALGKLFAVAESYPQLKANENFLQLQKELSDTEDKVAYARQYYNTTVMEYNVKTRVVPNALIANWFGFKPKEFFKTTEEEKKTPKVSFKE